MKNRLLLTVIIICSFLYSHTQTISFHRIDGTITTLELMNIDSITFSQGVIMGPPIAGFSANPRSGFSPLEVFFVDTSLNNPEVWHWDFGDGNTSNDQDPIHLYEVSGTYSIQLTVINEFGEDTLKQSDFIIVIDDPDAFYCGISQVSDLDGNIYNTILINNQCWLKENLRTAHYNNGDAIPTGLSDTEWSSITIGAFAYYNNDEVLLESYGKLYNWFAIDDPRGLCPAGWSVPTEDDWTQLADYLVAQGFPNNSQSSQGAGNALKSCKQVGSPLDGHCDTSEHPRWDSHGTHHGFDEFGFSGLPGGYRSSNGSFGGIGIYNFLWSSTEFEWLARSRSLLYNFGHLHVYSTSKSTGQSVRCIKDN